MEPTPPISPSALHPPPPKRLVPARPPVDPNLPPKKETWKAWFARHGETAAVKGIAISDTVGGRLNGWAENYAGAERFWPTTGDGPVEMEKAARIIKAFTVHGVGVKTEKKDEKTGKKLQRKVMRKIPAKILRQAKGLVIFSSMRNGIFPFGWSAPSFVSPNNLTVGFMAGLDLFDCILVLRTQAAVDTFYTHKVTIGSEIAVAAGPYGSGASIEVGVDKQPVLSYIRTRGLYAGVELVGQAFLSRWDENERVYYWPGITQKDILTGRTRAPREAESLFNAIEDAESGAAQRAHGDENEFEEVIGVWDDGAVIDLEPGETLKLPPTPEQLEREEEDEEWKRQREERNKGRFLR
ncbi:hypothetical protein Rhopal_002326-T1 [Rhodotorula paludigena]|uniref:Ysc84 actin-binding domain-containing protein n=1 Tax=Rhodotorula paludigena TaxID=86838 RepID=A0AAV5GAC8_9BASI|nr:hypothetical protein Rhopal_002326-T1 [Rhodotorula paludigena]